jgi:hypothetical protein
MRDKANVLVPVTEQKLSTNDYLTVTEIYMLERMQDDAAFSPYLADTALNYSQTR